jgi:hypothetical protein
MAEYGGQTALHHRHSGESIHVRKNCKREVLAVERFGGYSSKLKVDIRFSTFSDQSI